MAVSTATPTPAPAIPPTASDTDRLAALERKLDRMAEQMEILYQRSQAVDDLREELAVVGREVLGAAGEELAVVQDALDAETLRHLMRALVRSVPLLLRALERLESLDALMQELEPLGRELLLGLTEQLERAEARGYFRLARGSAALLDRISTHATEEDIQRLADNIVVIVDTVKRMTQPQMLDAVNRVVEVLDHPENHAHPVGLFGLLRALRDPEVQRGLGVAVELLRQVSTPPAASGATPTPPSQT